MTRTPQKHDAVTLISATDLPAAHVHAVLPEHVLLRLLNDRIVDAEDSDADIEFALQFASMVAANQSQSAPIQDCSAIGGRDEPSDDDMSDEEADECFDLADLANELDIAGDIDPSPQPTNCLEDDALSNDLDLNAADETVPEEPALETAQSDNESNRGSGSSSDDIDAQTLGALVGDAALESADLPLADDEGESPAEPSQSSGSDENEPQFEEAEIGALMADIGGSGAEPGADEEQQELKDVFGDPDDSLHETMVQVKPTFAQDLDVHPVGTNDTPEEVAESSEEVAAENEFEALAEAVAVAIASCHDEAIAVPDAGGDVATTTSDDGIDLEKTVRCFGEEQLAELEAIKLVDSASGDATGDAAVEEAPPHAEDEDEEALDTETNALADEAVVACTAATVEDEPTPQVEPAGDAVLDADANVTADEATEPAAEPSSDDEPAPQAETADDASLDADTSAIADDVADLLAEPGDVAEPSPQADIAESAATDSVAETSGDEEPTPETDTADDAALDAEANTSADEVAELLAKPGVEKSAVPSSDSQPDETVEGAEEPANDTDALLADADASEPQEAAVEDAAEPSANDGDALFAGTDASEPQEPTVEDEPASESPDSVDAAIAAPELQEPTPGKVRKSEPLFPESSIDPAGVEAPTETPAANTREGSTAGDEEFALTNNSVDKVQDFLGDLKSALVDMAHRPQPNVDVEPLVQALQAGFDRSAEQAAQTSTAVASLSEHMTQFGKNIEGGVQKSINAIQSQHPIQPVPCNTSEPNFVAERSTGQAVVLGAISLVVLGWSILFWIKTGSPRLALGTLIGANAIACCLLLSRRDRS